MIFILLSDIISYFLITNLLTIYHIQFSRQAEMLNLM